MLRLGPANAAAARRWWELLLPGAGARFAEVRLGGGRFAVVRRQDVAGGGGTARVPLDPHGLPAPLANPFAGADRVAHRLRAWKVCPARGRSALLIQAPPALHAGG